MEVEHREGEGEGEGLSNSKDDEEQIGITWGKWWDDDAATGVEDDAEKGLPVVGVFCVAFVLIATLAWLTATWNIFEFFRVIDVVWA